MPRPKHVPERSCVACRRKSAKGDFVRVARTAAGEVVAPAEAKTPGRGAYLCRTAACVELALRKGALARALHGAIDDETAGQLRRVVSNLSGSVEQ